MQMEECLAAAPRMMARAMPVQDAMMDACVDDFLQLKNKSNKDDMHKMIEMLARESISMDGMDVMASADVHEEEEQDECMNDLASA